MGVEVHALNLPTAVDTVIEAARAGRPLGVSALAVHGLVLASDDLELRYRINSLEMVVPDGQAVRWALNWLHNVGLGDRVMGSDLMREVCRRAAEAGLPIFLFGSEEQTLSLLRQRLEAAFPGLVVAGTQASRFRPATDSEAKNDANTIRLAGSRIVFVGLGCPRQEIWTFENRKALSMPLLAVGAAFDYHAGLIRRAPIWMQRAGLEWIYRLGQEPTRLWRRYLLLNPRYIVGILLQRLGWRDYPTIGKRPRAEVRPG